MQLKNYHGYLIFFKSIKDTAVISGLLFCEQLSKVVFYLNISTQNTIDKI